MHNHLVISTEKWNPENIKEDYLRSALALEHLIRNNFASISDVRFVEIGPICSVDELKPDHIAPISELYRRNPALKCMGYGCEMPSSDEEKEKSLGKVEMIRGILTTESFGNDSLKLLFERLGGFPNIIYGQHVFENSKVTSRSLPFGPSKPFEKAAEILQFGGFIVVDNYHSSLRSIGKEDHWEFTRKMQLEYSYMHSKDEGIFVFKKM